ncbi:MAG: hypothetical protein N2448_11400 [Caloramator sp.]|nr:hypothetical protein [Caloramator sp.]
MKVLDILMWIMFFISFVISIITTIVLFGISYGDVLKPFTTMLPLEISLAFTLFLWGLSSLYGCNVSDEKSSPKISTMLFALGGILLLFLVFGIY